VSITLTDQNTGDERRLASALASESDEKRVASAPLASASAVGGRSSRRRVGGKCVCFAV
jgi:hypothetical protein